ALWYVDIRYVDSWKGILDGTKPWAVHKAALLAYYPGLDSLYKYLVNDIRKLVDSSAAKEVSKPDHFAQYHCEFMIIASYLETERLMTKDDIDRQYILGLPPNFRATVLRQLNAEDPKRTPGLPYEYLEVNRAARHVLQEIVYSEPIVETSSRQIKNIKQEITDQLTTSLFQFPPRMFQKFDKFGTGVGALSQNTLSRAHLTSAPNFACLFRRGNHRIRNCPEAARMIKEGKCKQEPDRRIVMPAGSLIRGHGTLKDRIEETRFTVPLEQAPLLAPKFEQKAAITPQYKLASDIEDPELVKQVTNKFLEGTITLSQKELLTVSSDVRRFYKDKTTAKRLPTVGMIEVSIDEESENRTYVLRLVQGDRVQRKVLTASPINRLCVIFAILNNSVKAECVLDQVSEIMAMDKKVWEETQHELKPNKTISMESANNQSSLMAGLCENLKMKFENIELYLQVHVV
ncbi:hypothetical protein GALMADRAFT_34693, partial [Galerina marginata CBS 339.88]